MVYNYPVLKTTGPNLPGELLIMLSSLADDESIAAPTGRSDLSKSSMLPTFPFLTEGQSVARHDPSGAW